MSIRDKKEQGATLITALVMLLVLTLLVISAIRSSTTNLRIAGNMQIQQESIAATQQAIEQVISDNFSGNPAAAASNVQITIGPTKYTATVSKPTCTGVAAISNNDPTLPSACKVGQSFLTANSGMVNASGVSTAPSLCSVQQWDVQATVTDPATGATATVHQGVSMKVLGTSC